MATRVRSNENREQWLRLPLKRRVLPSRPACVNGHRSRTFAHFCDPPSDHIIPVSFVVSRSETPQIESENHGRGALLCATFWVSSHFRAARNGTREIQILLRK